MRTFEFKPSYYEWHLTDKATGKILLNIVDPSDDLDNGMTYEQVHDIANEWLDEAERRYHDNDEYNGVLPDYEPLDEEEKETAATLIAETLYAYYLS
jgi:hypothetical protein